MHLLASQLDHGLYPYAGVPWFSCPFGRDGLITARQLLLFEPRLARGVLGYLAEHQARLSDPANDAEPGKVLHEARLREMAALGEVPFAHYYGSVDATQLFLILAGDYLMRSGDHAFIRDIHVALDSAMAWIRNAEGRAADGFLRYQCAAQGGLRNQGWKDSDDAVHHADGRLAEGSIALCEVRASNAGHCLWTGLASKKAASAIARQLMAPTSFNGWGIRTLDEGEARYNPMSYHNGSVWPHDNSLIALGLTRYGHTPEAMRVLMGLFDTAQAMPLHRLPELFCGFQRQPDEGPTHYPVACSPQAWASGSLFGLLEAITGMWIGHNPESGRVEVVFRNPVLPERINLLEIHGLRLGEEEIDLQLHRGEVDTGVLVKRRSSGVDVVIHK